MILGCGVDLIEVARFERELSLRGTDLLDELFNPAELERCRARRRPAEGYAMGFAAKEACLKALGTGKIGVMGWRDIDVVQGASRAHPTVTLAGETAAVAASLGVTRVHAALTCTREFGAAWVVATGRGCRSRGARSPEASASGWPQTMSPRDVSGVITSRLRMRGSRSGSSDR
jgi:holo-[acyl-carrier protein] synthase